MEYLDRAQCPKSYQEGHTDLAKKLLEDAVEILNNCNNDADYAWDVMMNNIRQIVDQE